jgi:hypothetical protein
MPRRERIALLRQTVGISGRDWMQSAATMHPLAQVYWANRSPQSDTTIAIDRIYSLLISGDDRRAAFYEIGELLNYGEWAAGEAAARATRDLLGIAVDVLLAGAIEAQSLSGPVNVPAEVTTNAQFLAYLESLRSPQARVEAFGLLAAVSWQEIEADPATAAAYVAQSPGLQPLNAFCSETCAATEPACLVSTAIAIDRAGYGYLPFASPLPVLISDDVYQSSARFAADLRARLATGDWPGCTPQ